MPHAGLQPRQVPKEFFLGAGNFYNAKSARALWNIPQTLCKNYVGNPILPTLIRANPQALPTNAEECRGRRRKIIPMPNQKKILLWSYEKKAYFKLRLTRAGLPAASEFGGMSFATTAPAAITHPEPIFTPGRSTAEPPIQQSPPISTGSADSAPEFLAATSSGWVAV